MLNAGVLIGLLIIVISIPLIFNKIRPNPWYGFRTPKTMSKPEIWYKANRYMAKNMLIAGIFIMAAFIILPILNHDFDPGIDVSIVLFILLTPVLIVIIKSFLYLRKL
ncbi:MAG: hypothetical protein BWY69_01675 [Planctomycetes bacterium ADurb.Bin401]|nr:MAG: hypothetical protein BWY69_01675 [Planctomycetes bacterium ADurb.Bin401]